MKQVKRIILITIALILLMSTTALAGSPKAPFLNYMNKTNRAVSETAKKSDTAKYADVYFQHGAGYAKYGIRFKVVIGTASNHTTVTSVHKATSLGHFKLNYKSGYGKQTDGYRLYTEWGSSDSGYLDSCYAQGVWYP